MAEALFRRHIASIHIHSAGIAALVGQPVSPEVKALMDRDNIKTVHHQARQLTQQMVQEADLILVMQSGQQSYIHAMQPTARGKVHLLGKWQGIEIPDPYQKSEEYFEHIFQLINESVEQWSNKLQVKGENNT